MALLALGQFLFSMDNIAFKEMQRSREWRHPTNSRVGARPAAQYIGPGEDMITLTGLQAPEFRGKRRALDDLAAMADTGSAYALVSGASNGDPADIFGAWTIRRIQHTGTFFTAEGIARRVEFTLELGHADDVQADPEGGAGDGGGGDDDDDDFWKWWLS